METPENKNDVFEPMPEEAAAQVTAENSADGNRSQKMAEAKKNLLAGALWCVGGLAFSFLSYYFATAGVRCAEQMRTSTGMSKDFRRSTHFSITLRSLSEPMTTRTFFM